jgi:hypothetical protein
MAEIASYFDVHYMTLSRAVRAPEGGLVMDVLMLELTPISRFWWD